MSIETGNLSGGCCNNPGMDDGGLDHGGGSGSDEK